jgi:hypothetical protein
VPWSRLRDGGSNLFDLSRDLPGQLPQVAWLT